MCRLLAYAGEPILLESLIVGQPLSLINQSRAAREAKTVVNGDGCGIGWYGEHAEPGLYRNILPAWSDANLASLCRQIRSGMFVAHVRSATSGEVAGANCHPFSAGRHLFAHNGQIGDYDRLRRRIDALIPESHYGIRRGTTDSEVLFLTALGRNLDANPAEAIGSTLGSVLRTVAEAGGRKPVRVAAVHADGERLRAYRWSSDAHAPTLYWLRLDGGVVVASEPFGDTGDDWVPILPGTGVTIGRDGSVKTEIVELTLAEAV